MLVKIVLDRGGMRSMLQSEGVRAVVMGHAVAVASKVRGNGNVVRHPLRVEAWSYTTDRAMGAITMMGPMGLPVEAKYGPLKKAVGS
jgi:hypothetical protein